MKKLIVILAVITAVIAASCASPPTGGGVSPPTSSVWFAGDSIARATAPVMPSLPYGVGVGGAGYTTHASSLIQANTTPKLNQFATPSRMLVLGGVNDLWHGATLQETINGFLQFTSDLTTRGIPFTVVLEPRWTVTAVDDFNAWVVASGFSFIDCRSMAGVSTDGLHPDDYVPFAACVDAAL